MKNAHPQWKGLKRAEVAPPIRVHLQFLRMELIFFFSGRLAHAFAGPRFFCLFPCGGCPILAESAFFFLRSEQRVGSNILIGCPKYSLRFLRSSAFQRCCLHSWQFFLARSSSTTLLSSITSSGHSGQLSIQHTIRSHTSS
jgi:hypothetical protein